MSDDTSPRDTAIRAAAAMRPALPKRFYKDASTAPAAGGSGYRILLDARSVRTPARRELALPTEALAQAVAEEWRAQTDQIDPATMPLTRLVNSAIDGVRGREPEVRADIVKYAGSDLLCYFAPEPAALAERQRKGWGPIHQWASERFGIRLVLAEGIMPVEQDAAMLARLAALLEAHEAFVLAALHVATTLTGSALLALALAQGRLDAAAAWSLAHIDEDFQIEQWGADEEATARRDLRWREMQSAAHLIALMRANPAR